MNIRILSFDFDGCLFNMDYIIKGKDIIKSNAEFLDNIHQENKAFDQVITFIGSNRQSKETDDQNASIGDKGSCFPAIQIINDHLNTTLDTLLLADIYGDLPAGTSFARAMDKEYLDKHSEWVFDNDKVTILYAQMHKIANQFPGEKLVLDFYDDKNTIHDQLIYFFKSYTHLIPDNLSLRLTHYAGEKVTPRAEIQGTGMIDVNYICTVKEMAELAINDVDFYGSFINSAKINADLLVNRSPLLSPKQPVHLQIGLLPSGGLCLAIASEKNYEGNNQLFFSVATESMNKVDALEKTIDNSASSTL